MGIPDGLCNRPKVTVHSRGVSMVGAYLSALVKRIGDGNIHDTAEVLPRPEVLGVLSVLAVELENEGGLQLALRFPHRIVIRVLGVQPERIAHPPPLVHHRLRRVIVELRVRFEERGDVANISGSH